MAITTAEVRVMELRINDEIRALKARHASIAASTGAMRVPEIKRDLEGRIDGLNTALQIFREEFGKNGRTTRAV